MIEIIDCPQNSDAWYRARLGLPTASMFKTIMANGRGGGESVSRRDYLLKLAGELVSGEPMENYSNAFMRRGKDMEDEARKFYSFLTSAEPKQIGFIKNGNKGCSPDSLIDEDGMLEVKTHAAHIMVELILKDDFPPRHLAQCQGQLWVAEREWLDLICYWPGFPPFVKRIFRDSAYIRQLSIAVEQFNCELAEIVERVRAYGA
jgi:hypothetical protein